MILATGITVLRSPVNKYTCSLMEYPETTVTIAQTIAQLIRRNSLSIQSNEHGGIRTPDPQNRNLMLYPLSYMPSLSEYSTSILTYDV